MVKKTFFLTILICFVFQISIAQALQKNSVDLKIATFNVLAPCWASPQSYPENCASIVENTSYRLTKIASEINALKAQDMDVFCFQEMTDEMFKGIGAILGSDYQGYIAYHDLSYWAVDRVSPDDSVPNGNATFVNVKKWDTVLARDIATYPDNGSGNHAMYLQIRPKKGVHVFHLVNVHLDYYDKATREKELAGALAVMFPYFKSPEDTEIVAGDLNANPTGAGLKQFLEGNHFTNLKASLEATHPFLESEGGPTIDHILVRNGTPLEGIVRHHDVWTTYPVLSPDTNDSSRIRATLETCGSDHFLVHGSLSYTEKNEHRNTRTNFKDDDYSFSDRR